MDSVVHAEDSSSANANRTLVSFSERASNGVVTITTQGGSSFLLRLTYISPLFWEAVSLPKDILPETLSLCDSELLFLVEAGEAYKAERYACDCLSRTEYSCFQLMQKLIKKHYSKSVAKSVVSYVSERGWASDERFATLWLKSRVKRHPESKALLGAKLAEKGISSQIIKETLDSFFSTTTEDSLLKTALQKYIRLNPTKTNEQIILSLQRKGFSFSKISKELKNLK